MRRKSEPIKPYQKTAPRILDSPPDSPPENVDLPNNRKNRVVQVALRLLGVLTIGAIGSGMWDVVAKPGLGWVVTSVLGVAGLFSQAVSDL